MAIWHNYNTFHRHCTTFFLLQKTIFNFQSPFFVDKSASQNYNKFSNMIGYHQPNLSANRTLYNHACLLDSVHIMPVKLDRMHHEHALLS